MVGKDLKPAAFHIQELGAIKKHNLGLFVKH